MMSIQSWENLANHCVYVPSQRYFVFELVWLRTKGPPSSRTAEPRLIKMARNILREIEALNSNDKSCQPRAACGSSSVADNQTECCRKAMNRMLVLIFIVLVAG
jgi:hypothetical protein